MLTKKNLVMTRRSDLLVQFNLDTFRLIGEELIISNSFYESNIQDLVFVFVNSFAHRIHGLISAMLNNLHVMV